MGNGNEMRKLLTRGEKMLGRNGGKIRENGAGIMEKGRLMLRVFVTPG